MSILRLIDIYLGLYEKQGAGIVDLNDIRDTWGWVRKEVILERAHGDSQRTINAKDRGHWKGACFWWSRAVSRFQVHGDEFVLYLMLAAKAPNIGRRSTGMALIWNKTMDVTIIEKTTGKVIFTYSVKEAGIGYTPSEKEINSTAWKCAIDDEPVDAKDREKYSFQVAR